MRLTKTLTGTMFIALLAPAASAQSNYTNNILLTGYWPQTNNMLRQFSTNPDQNPDGWAGENWNNSGYNIYAYFPEFPGQTGPSWGQGQGDFEVDYQDTSADWEAILPTINPAAIMTFSRGAAGSNWELEGRLQMHERRRWLPDYDGDRRPTKDMPVFQALTPGEWYDSSLPMDEIMADINGQDFGVDAFIDNNGGGRFLSEFIGLHGLMHMINNGSDSDYQTFAAGHIHVGIDTTLEDAERATEITLNNLTSHLDLVIPSPPGGAAFIALTATAFVRRRR
ncbi:MAG: hypothetical protein Phyf2KO_09850 [Phycisphaerales bacterium]